MAAVSDTKTRELQEASNCLSRATGALCAQMQDDDHIAQSVKSVMDDIDAYVHLQIKHGEMDMQTLRDKILEYRTIDEVSHEIHTTKVNFVTENWNLEQLAYVYAARYIRPMDIWGSFSDANILSQTLKTRWLARHMLWSGLVNISERLYEAVEKMIKTRNFEAMPTEALRFFPQVMEGMGNIIIGNASTRWPRGVNIVGNFLLNAFVLNLILNEKQYEAVDET